MATLTTTTTTTASNAAQAVGSNPVTSFHWHAESNSTRLSYIDPETTFRVGSRSAWYPTDYFEDHVWREFLYPKLLNVFNKNQKEIFGSRRKPFAEIKCYMTSESTLWKESRPTVIASSTKPKVAQNIISVLTMNPIIARLRSGFDFYADPDPADTITSARTSELYPPDFDAAAHSLCGVRILVAPRPGSSSSKWKRATLGGLLQIDNAYYGLTAAHVFSGYTDTGSDLTEDSESDYSDSSRTSLTQKSSAASLYSSSHLRSGTAVYIDPTKYATTTNDNGQRGILPDGDGLGLHPENVLGELHGADSQGPWLSAGKDWALIRIQDPKYHLPNTIQLNGRTIECSSIATSIPHGQVAVASGFGGVKIIESSGRTRGVLLPGAPEMITLWTIEGSSYLTNGQVYGMLLASSNSQNSSYCLSMSEIFDSIISTCGVNTPAIFQSKEHQLGDGLRRSSIADARAPTQSSTALGDTVDQESSRGEQATDSRGQSNTDKPVMGPQVAINTPDTTKEHNEPPTMSEEAKISTPTAYNPEDETVLKAFKLGDSCYEIPTTKVDRSVAKKLGYEVWLGQSSSVIETYGREFDFNHLLRESRLQRQIAYPPKVSVESMPDDDGKKLSSDASTIGNAEVIQNVSHEEPNDDRDLGLARELNDENDLVARRGHLGKTGEPDLPRNSEATPPVKPILHRKGAQAGQEDDADKMSDIQLDEHSKLGEQGLDKRIVKSKRKESSLLPSAVLSKSGNDRESHREREITIRRDAHDGNEDRDIHIICRTRNENGDLVRETIHYKDPRDRNDYYDRAIVKRSTQEQARDREELVIARDLSDRAKDGVEKLTKENDQDHDRNDDSNDDIDRSNEIRARPRWGSAAPWAHLADNSYYSPRLRPRRSRERKRSTSRRTPSRSRATEREEIYIRRDVPNDSTSPRQERSYYVDEDIFIASDEDIFIPRNEREVRAIVDDRRDYESEIVFASRRDNRAEETRGRREEGPDSGINQNPGYTTMNRDVIVIKDDDYSRVESYASRKTDQTEDISVARGEITIYGTKMETSNVECEWDDDFKELVVRHRCGPNRPAKEIIRIQKDDDTSVELFRRPAKESIRIQVSSSKITRAEPRMEYRRLEASTDQNMLSAEEQRLLQEEHNNPRSSNDNKFLSERKDHADYHDHKDLERADTSGREYDATRDSANIKIRPGTSTPKHNLRDGGGQSSWHDPAGVHHGPVVEPQAKPRFESSGDSKSRDEAVKQRPRKGTTKVPKALVKTRVLFDLGYDWVEIDDQTILIEHALGKEDIDEILALSRGPLSADAAKDGRSTTVDSQHHKATGDLPLSQSATPRHGPILQGHRNLLEKSRETEERLRLRCRIQQDFLEEGLSAMSRVERIMSYVDEYLGAAEEQHFAEVVEEHEILAEPELVPAPQTTNSLKDLEDKLTDEVYRLRLGLQNYRLRLNDAEQVDDMTDKTSTREANIHQRYRSTQLQDAPSIVGSSNVKTFDEETFDEEKYRQLKQKYQASAMARGLSLKQINTILNKVDTASRESWGDYQALRCKALQALLKDSGTEQKEVSWSDPPISHTAFAGREERYRSGEMPPPPSMPKRGLSGRQTRHDTNTFDARPLKRTTDIKRDDSGTATKGDRWAEVWR
ncbi:hypothetical protein LTR20_002825 [Exophiala xenobiotica]|nr:hypothetical protein LTR20_002825 [Exophiala xenobiotica]